MVSRMPGLHLWVAPITEWGCPISSVRVATWLDCGRACKPSRFDLRKSNLFREQIWQEQQETRQFEGREIECPKPRRAGGQL